MGNVRGCFFGYFYPRSPCGERQGTLNLWDAHRVFLSTLSLRRATWEGMRSLSEGEFQSTLSLRRATLTGFFPTLEGHKISIHALLAESDSGTSYSINEVWAFLSTLSLRRATTAHALPLDNLAFLSTLSLRRATAKVHKTVGHFCAYGTNFMGIASSC